MRMNGLRRSSLQAALFLLLAGGLIAAPAQAAQAGIVIDLGGGNVTTQCVKFQGPMITAFDLLQLSGLDFTFQNFGTLGAAICSVEEVGCQFPAEACFCQCTGVGPCNFFGFYILEDGEFVFADVGISSQILRNKDVIALSFGEQTTAPTGVSVKDICPDN